MAKEWYVIRAISGKEKKVKEYLESEILKTIEQNNVLNNSALITFAVFRNFSQSLLPKTNQVSWFISCQALTSSFYTIDEEPYEVELF